MEVINLIKERGAEVAGVGFIVDRSNKRIDFKANQFAVVRLDAETYLPDSCPFCKEGIPIDKPGSRSL